MDFKLTEGQESLIEAARKFAQNELAPLTAERDEKEEFPRESFRKMAELGFAGMFCLEEYGGTNRSFVGSVGVLLEIAKACAASALTLAIHLNTQGSIVRHGTQSQKNRFLPDMASGKILGAFAITEPGAGSDAASLQTYAQKKEGFYLINGTKTLISNGGEADLYLVMAKTDKTKGTKGISSFLIEKGTPGFEFGKKEKKLGFRASPTRELIFDGCKVPADHLLGQEGAGFQVAMGALDVGRMLVSCVNMGSAIAAFENAVQYSKTRIQFRKPICEFQAIQFSFADMATQLQAAKWMVYHAAYLLDQKLPATQFCSMAKLFATEAAFQICHQALQVFGGYGYTKVYPMERYFRDTRLGLIVDGTSEIQRIVIARSILK
jgi:butyryl-CoA dehydrogenase